VDVPRAISPASPSIPLSARRIFQAPPALDSKGNRSVVHECGNSLEPGLVLPPFPVVVGTAPRVADLGREAPPPLPSPQRLHPLGARDRAAIAGAHLQVLAGGGVVGGASREGGRVGTSRGQEGHQRLGRTPYPPGGLTAGRAAAQHPCLETRRPPPRAYGGDLGARTRYPRNAQNRLIRPDRPLSRLFHPDGRPGRLWARAAVSRACGWASQLAITVSSRGVAHVGLYVGVAWWRPARGRALTEAACFQHAWTLTTPTSAFGAK
jgi:hypothetical protein